MEHDQELVQETKEELTARQLVAVALRLFALLTFIGLLFSIRNIIANALTFQDDPKNAIPLSTWLIVFGSFLLSLLLVGWLWFFPETSAEWIVPEEHNGLVRLDLTFREIQALVFSLFGVVLLTQVLPRLARFIGNIWIQQEQLSRDANLLEYLLKVSTPDLIEVGAQIILAIILIFWSQRIVKRLYFSNNADLENQA